MTRQLPTAMRQWVLAGWIRDGRLRPLEDILDGIEQMPHAPISLHEGANTGVRMVRVDPDAERASTR